MPTYLKIENPGVCPVEGFILLGATSKRLADNDSPYTIGQFGSGGKHAVNVLLRAKLYPIVFCGNHRLEYGTKPGKMKALEGQTDYNRVIVKHGGTDEDGASVTFTEELSQTDEYGVLDWNCMGMAFREFVSNAIDAAIAVNRQAEGKAKWPWDGVKVELVPEEKVRAKTWLHPRLCACRQRRGYPLLRKSGQVVPAFLGAGSNHPGNPHEEIPQPRCRLPYRRHFSSWCAGPGDRPVFFRVPLRLQPERSAGGRIPQCGRLPVPKCGDEGDGKGQPGSPGCLDAVVPRKHALLGASIRRLRTQAAMGRDCRRNRRPQGQLEQGPGIGRGYVVLAAKDGPVQTLARKGYDPLEVPETVVRAAEEYGCPTPSKILSADELDGRESFDPTPDAVAALDWVWERINQAGMDDGKAKPEIRCFRKVMNGGTVVLGFLRDGIVYVNEDLATGASVELRQTVLEEVAHYLTESKDCTRDLQDWAFKLAVRVAMAVEPVAG